MNANILEAKKIIFKIKYLFTLISIINLALIYKNQSCDKEVVLLVKKSFQF